MSAVRNLKRIFCLVVWLCLCCSPRFIYASPTFASQENESFCFWQVTDFHWDQKYVVGGNNLKMCHAESNAQSGGGAAAAYGDYLCDSPSLLIDSAIQFMATKPNASFAIWTGDDVPHVSESEMSKEILLDSISNLTERLSSLPFPVIPVLGNHDFFPKGQFPSGPNWLYSAVAQMWSRWLPPSALKTFSLGSFFSLKLPPNLAGVRVIGLNTGYYYTQNKVVNTSDASDPVGQLGWLLRTLQSARDSNERVYVVSHVPPGMFERSENTSWFYPSFNRRFLSILSTYTDVIAGQFFAHQHSDSFHVVWPSAQDRDPSVILLAPSVTPWKTTLPGVSANNPGLRYYCSAFDGRLLRYEQYFLNLTAANEPQGANWKLEYDSRRDLMLPDLSGPSFVDLARRMLPLGSDVFRRYHQYNSVSCDCDTNCDSVCQQRHMCSILHADYDEYFTCMKQRRYFRN